VEQVQDLDRAAIGELPGGGVALPGLVGELSLEADEGGLGALVRLGCDVPLPLQDAPDGSGRGELREAVLEVEEDGRRARVEAGVGDLPAQLEDLCNNRGRNLFGGAFVMPCSRC